MSASPKPGERASIRNTTEQESRALMVTASNGMVPTEPWEGDGPCQDCGGKNIVWFTDNKLFNRVMPNGAGILCVNCFVRRSYAVGINPTGWKLEPEVQP